jgi:hypothetical protein
MKRKLFIIISTIYHPLRMLGIWFNRWAVIPLRLKYYKKKADNLSKEFNRKFYLLQNGSKYIIVNNDFISHYNKKNKGSKINIYDLIKMSCYITK